MSNDTGNTATHMTLETQQQKKKVAKLYFIITKNLSASKGIIKKVKRKPTEWKEYWQIMYLKRDLGPKYIKNS